MKCSFRTATTLAAVAGLTLAASVPAWAHAFGRSSSPAPVMTHRGSPPSGTPAAHASSASTASGARPSVAVPSTPIPSSPSVAPTAASPNASPAASHAHRPPHRGPSHAVLAAVTKLHVLQHEVHQARLAYVSALKTYLQTLSRALSTPNATVAKTAVAQLAAINVTLAHAVQTEKSAQLASASTSLGSTGALSTVLARFQAELAALTDATHQVDEMTAKLVTVTSTSGSSSAPATTSPS
jgi:hypothetical protein